MVSVFSHSRSSSPMSPATPGEILCHQVVHPVFQRLQVLNAPDRPEQGHSCLREHSNPPPFACTCHHHMSHLLLQPRAPGTEPPSSVKPDGNRSPAGAGLGSRTCP